MTRRQRRIIVTLAVADLAFILGLVALMTHLARGTALSLPTLALRTMPPTSGSPASAACQWQAAQQMAQAGLSGSVTLSTDTLHFETTAALAPGQTTDDAAQLIWAAFDVALALPDECGFTQIEVTIRIRDTATTLHASVGTGDLRAYGTGNLTEEEFIGRVTYTIDG